MEEIKQNFTFDGIEDFEIEDVFKSKLPKVVPEIIAGMGRDQSPDHLGFPFLPSHKQMVEIIDLAYTILYPGYFGEQGIDKNNLGFYIGNQVNKLYAVLSRQVARCLMHKCFEPGKMHCHECVKKGKKDAFEIIEKIPQIRKMLQGDIKAAFDGDPAAKDYQEIIFCYPGIKAVTIYRIAHELNKMQIPFLPRMMTEYAHSITGCDIHAGAQIGNNFFIDHATGVVIGETSVIGNNVRIYQGVTLGSLRFPKDKEGNLLRDIKRHPTIEDDVIIYANATILGGETVVGKGSVIGGNVWLTQSVPPNSKITTEPVPHKIKTQ